MQRAVVPASMCVCSAPNIHVAFVRRVSPRNLRPAASSVRECDCTLARANTPQGVCAFAGGKGTFEKCEIYNNKFSGVEVSGENTEVTLKECVIHGNRRDGVLVCDLAKCTLEGSQVRRNYHSGLEVRDKASATATGNTIESNDFGVVVARAGVCNLAGNAICGNFITGVELSKADLGEEGDERPLCELTDNKINCNLECGLKIWYQVRIVYVRGHNGHHSGLGNTEKDAHPCFLSRFFAICPRTHALLCEV